MQKKLRSPVWECGKCPAGGRIRFSTNSKFLGIKASTPQLVMSHMPQSGHSGFDVYHEDVFHFCVWPDETGTIDVERQIAADTTVMRTIEINLPLYNRAELNAIGIEEGAVIAPPKPYRLKDPVIFYGTSITQGGCASTPGTTWEGFLSRRLGIDFVNLGFSGQGWADIAVAEAIAELNASCIVLDHWANICHNPLGYRGSIGPFIKVLRDAMPTVPIILTGPYFYPAEFFNADHHALRKEIRASVRALQKNGDANIHFFDSRKMMGPEETFGTVDGCHPTSLGFYLMAKAFAPALKKLLCL